jgi:diguanylate cyclase (GGDEF)-like protein
MTDESTRQVLAWERTLLASESVAEWLEACAAPPGDRTGDSRVSLLLADPTFELRHLVSGQQATEGASSPVAFVDGLAGLAPQLAALHEPWRGDFRAADHALLFPGIHGLRHLLMLPLRRGGNLVGVYCLAGALEPPALAAADPVLLDHVGTVLGACHERVFDHARLLRGGLVDALTGWHSSRYLKARLREEIARCQRNSVGAACLVVDVDRLRAVNDEFGQRAGDRVLRELAQRVESQVRSSDAAARVGSDEFAVLLPDCDVVRARPLAERILASVRAAAVDLGAGRTRRMTVSIGIAAVAPGPAEDRKTAADQLLAEAMAAMHRVKRRGGDDCEPAVPA